MTDIQTIQNQIATKEAEIKSMRKEIEETNSLLLAEAKAKEMVRIQEKYGDMIKEINIKLRTAACALEGAINIAKEAGITSLTGYDSYEQDEEKRRDLSAIGELIELQILVDQLYKAGIESCCW
jgi:hypothetical protein